MGGGQARTYLLLRTFKEDAGEAARTYLLLRMFQANRPHSYTAGSLLAYRSPRTTRRHSGRDKFLASYSISAMVLAE